MQTFEIPIENISRTKFQTRHSLGDSTWAEGVGALAEDIGRQGQLAPAIVIENTSEFGQPYILIVGHRRAAACEMLGKPLLCLVESGQGVNAYELMQMVSAENVLREGWTPVERGEMEVRMYRAAYVNGKISTKTHQVHGFPTYAELRTQQTGESRKTIENYLNLGNATPRLKHAVDIASAKDKAIRRSATLTVSGGYSLARFDAETQVHTLNCLEANGVNRAGPQEVASMVNAVRQRAGLPAIKNGEEYEPGEATKTLGAEVALTKTINHLLVEALEFYADDSNWAGMIYYHGERESPSVMDYGDRARQTLAKLSLVMNTPGIEDNGDSETK